MTDQNQPIRSKVEINQIGSNPEENRKIEGIGMIYGIITGQDGERYKVTAGTLSVMTPREIEVMLAALLETLWNVDKFACMGAIAQFAQKQPAFKFKVEGGVAN